MPGFQRRLETGFNRLNKGKIKPEISMKKIRLDRLQKKLPDQTRPSRQDLQNLKQLLTAVGGKGFKIWGTRMNSGNVGKLFSSRGYSREATFTLLIKLMRQSAGSPATFSNLLNRLDRARKLREKRARVTKHEKQQQILKWRGQGVKGRAKIRRSREEAKVN